MTDIAPMPTPPVPRARDLPAAVWRLEAASLISAIGSGFVLPFELIYFHDVRGFSFAVSGLIAAMFGFAPLLGTPVAGSLIDRLGARAVLIASLLTCAIGSALFPLVRVPWEGFVAAAVTGLGVGAMFPSQGSLVGVIAPAESRHLAFSLQRTSLNLGLGIGGLIGGFVASTSDPSSFTLLFVIDAATSAVFALLVLALAPDARSPRDEEAPEVSGGYRTVLRNRPFVGVLALTTVIYTAGMAMFQTVMPVYVHTFAGVPEAVIGVYFSINTGLVVLLQLPIARRLHGRRSMRAIRLAALIWAVALVAVVAGASGLRGAGAAVVIGGGVVLWTIGECVQSAVFNPLVVELAPAALLGRFVALSSLSMGVGFALAPAIAGSALGAAPTATWIVAAVVCVLAAGACARLERSLPAGARRMGT